MSDFVWNYLPLDLEEGLVKFVLSMSVCSQLCVRTEMWFVYVKLCRWFQALTLPVEFVDLMQKFELLFFENTDKYK